jgi:predicted ATPase
MHPIHDFPKILQSIFFEEIKASVTKGLGTDAAFLSRLIPALTHITGTEREYHEIQPENMGRAFVRFKIVVRNFVRSAATAKHPICLFLDDTQWAVRAVLRVLFCYNVCRVFSIDTHVFLTHAPQTVPRTELL